MYYTCPLCSGTFSHRGSLARHLSKRTCPEISTVDNDQELLELALRESEDRTFDDRLEEGFRMAMDDAEYDDELTEEDEED